MDVYIGMGSNLGDRTAWLSAGVRGLRDHQLPILAISAVWESEPMGTDRPEWFHNLVLQAQVDRDPRELLDLISGLERKHGRIRREPNGPRTLDIDLLIAGDSKVAEPDLTLPHPRMWGRRFVLEPLAEIAPDLVNPDSGRTVAEECRRIRDSAVVHRLGALAPAEGALL